MRPAVVLAVLCLGLPSAAEEDAKAYDLRRVYRVPTEAWTVFWEWRTTDAQGREGVQIGAARVNRAEYRQINDPPRLELLVAADIFPTSPYFLGVGASFYEFTGRGRTYRLKDSYGYAPRTLGASPPTGLLDTLTRSLVPERPVARLSKWTIDEAFGLPGIGVVRHLRFRLENVKTSGGRTIAVVSVRCKLGMKGSAELTGVMLLDLATGLRHSLRLEGESDGKKGHYLLREKRRALPPPSELLAAPDAAKPAGTRIDSTKGDFSLEVPEGWSAKQTGGGTGVRMTHDATKATLEVRLRHVARHKTAAGQLAPVLRQLRGASAKIDPPQWQVIGGDVGYGVRYVSGYKTGWRGAVTDGHEHGWELHARMRTKDAKTVMPEVRAIVAALQLPGPRR